MSADDCTELEWRRLRATPGNTALSASDVAGSERQHKALRYPPLSWPGAPRARFSYAFRPDTPVSVRAAYLYAMSRIEWEVGLTFLADTIIDDEDAVDTPAVNLWLGSDRISDGDIEDIASRVPGALVLGGLMPVDEDFYGYCVHAFEAWSGVVSYAVCSLPAQLEWERRWSQAAHMLAIHAVGLMGHDHADDTYLSYARHARRCNPECVVTPAERSWIRQSLGLETTDDR